MCKKAIVIGLNGAPIKFPLSRILVSPSLFFHRYHSFFSQVPFFFFAGAFMLNRRCNAFVAWNALFCPFATYRCHFSFIYLCHSFPAIIENQPFTDFVKISCKKVAIMFGQQFKSIYLCIRNREGHPLRVLKERVLWKYFPYRQVVQEAILWCRHKIG